MNQQQANAESEQSPSTQAPTPQPMTEPHKRTPHRFHHQRTLNNQAHVPPSPLKMTQSSTQTHRSPKSLLTIPLKMNSCHLTLTILHLSHPNLKTVPVRLHGIVGQASALEVVLTRQPSQKPCLHKGTYIHLTLRVNTKGTIGSLPKKEVSITEAEGESTLHNFHAKIQHLTVELPVAGE